MVIRHHIQFPPFLVPQGNPLCLAIHTLPTSPQTHQEILFKVYPLHRSDFENSSIIKASQYRSPLKILRKLGMKTPMPEAYYADDIFKIKCPICAVDFAKYVKVLHPPLPPSKKNCPLSAMKIFLQKKAPLLYEGGDTMYLPQQQIIWWYVLPQYLHRSRLKLTQRQIKTY